ncbi:MAG TPA: JAB domain-containing protein [Gemmatimonadaceae bacterium]|jgi:DNA repair protein RadC
MKTHILPFGIATETTRVAATIAENGEPYSVPKQARRPITARKFRRLTTLRLVKESSFSAPEGYPADDMPIRSPRDVFERMIPYAERETAEVFWVLPLNAQHHLIGGAPEAVTRGILNSSLVHPREVFLCAIVARAAAVVLCHNHPSGDPTPSSDDRAVTEQLVAAGRLLDIPVVDHVIVGRCRYTSFAEAGLL